MAMKAIVLAALLPMALWGQDADLVRVKGKGTGETEEIALKDAYRDAVETAVGMYVDAEQQVKDDQLVKDEILTHSNAYVEDYSVVDKRQKNGLFVITIAARVRKQALTKRLKGAMDARTFQVGGALSRYHAQDATKTRRDADGSALLEKTLRDFSPVVMTLDCSLASPEPVLADAPASGRTRHGSRPAEADNVVANYLFAFEINAARYYETVSSRLRGVLAQVSVARPFVAEISVAKQGRFDFEYCLGRERLRSGKVRNGSRKDQRVEIKTSSTAFRWGGVRMRSPKDRIKVVLVTGENSMRTMFRGEVYELDGVTAQALADWRDSAGGRQPAYAVSFCGEGGEPLVRKELTVARKWTRLECCCWETITIPSTGETFRAIVIAPWIKEGNSAFAISQYRWQGFTLPKEVLPVVRTIKVELAR